MSKKKSLLMSLFLVLIMGISIVAGTYAYFQWSTGYEGGTQVNVTIEMGGIKMHIEPEATGFVGLYPTAHCENNVRYGDTLVRIENNTGALAVPSFKLKVKINPSTLDTGELNYYKEHVHYAVVALETTKDASGNPVKGEPVGGNILDNLVTGTCKNPLSVSSTQDTDDTFKSDYGKNATGLFNTITAENTFADTVFLPREYNSSTGEVSGVTFRGEAYSTSYQYYRVYVWIDEGYTTTIIGNNVTDPLQNAQISVTWSENSMLQQVSGESNVEPVLAAGLYDNDGNMTYTWQELLDNGDVTVEGTTIIDVTDENGDSPISGNLIIPSEITSIGDMAFAYSVLESISFVSGSRLTSIGALAFEFSYIESIELPAGVTSIGNNAFYSSSFLSAITFKGTEAQWDAITKEYDWNFGVPATEVVCSDGYVYLIEPGHYANGTLFYTWSELLNSSVFLDGTTITRTIPMGGTLFIPNEITEIGDSAFSNSDIAEIKFGSGSRLTSIGESAFSYAYIKNINIPAGVTNIGGSAFFDSMVEKITFAENSQLTSIGSGAFAYAAELTYLELPASITSIDAAALEGCSSLTTIKFKGTVSEWNAITKDEGWFDYASRVRVICTDGEVEL